MKERDQSLNVHPDGFTSWRSCLLSNPRPKISGFRCLIVGAHKAPSGYNYPPTVTLTDLLHCPTR
jgi:hypothetical protein